MAQLHFLDFKLKGKRARAQIHVVCLPLTQPEYDRVMRAALEEGHPHPQHLLKKALLEYLDRRDLPAARAPKKPRRK